MTGRLTMFSFAQPGTFLDHSIAEVPIRDFVNKELILFSMADNVRSIPSVVDGFKPGQRKVLYGCFKRKLKKEIKVRHIQLQLGKSWLADGRKPS
jgi:DNA topoisomerase-2